MNRTCPLVACFLLVAASAARAEPSLTLPDASPKASISQTVALTEMEIRYHRPGVNKRVIWGGLVPWNEVWRAGANENTTISFSTPVTIDGKKLAAGRYGLHMIPGEKSWTVILSTMADAWGSYFYDPKEDAVRVTVTPQPAELTERLAYSFDDPTDRSVVVALRWEKLRVPFTVEVDTAQTVLASLRTQLRNVAGFYAEPFQQAAAWGLEHGLALDEAEKWVESSLKLRETFGNLWLKAEILEKKGDAKGAAAMRERAFKAGTENAVNLEGYRLLAKGNTDGAIALFLRMVKEHPQSWNAWDSLAEALEKKGDRKGAIDGYTRASKLVTDAQQKKRIGDILARLKK